MSIANKMVAMMTAKGAAVKKELDRITGNPMAEQQALLEKIIEWAKDTDFGIKYGLASIKTITDLRKHVPLTDYDVYAPYTERASTGEKGVITSQRIVHFNVTSGTLGAPKLIPVTESHIKFFSRYNAQYLNYLVSQRVGTAWTKKKGLSLTEGTYEYLPSGVSVGSASSIMAARIGKMIAPLNVDMMNSMYSSPVEARQPVPGTPTRYIHARFALMDGSLSYANATFSCYLLEIMRYIEDNWRRLVEEIRTGTISEDIIMPCEVRASLTKKLHPMPERAAELERIFTEGFDTSIPIMKRLWPNMCYILCVGGACFVMYTKMLKDRYCGNDMTFLYLGLSASEGYISTPVAVNDTSSVFVPNAAFFEFLPVDNGVSDYTKPLLLNEIEVGKEYELVISNLNGFFRYRMNDVIRVTGFYNNTPKMEFVSRLGNAINMFGEKTTEQMLLSTAINTVTAEGLEMYDYAFYPDRDAVPGKYVMLLELRDNGTKVNREHIRATAQYYLSEANPSLGAKFRDSICGPLELKILQPETFLLYKDMQVMRGISAAQLKPIHVLTPVTKNFFFAFEETEE